MNGHWLDLYDGWAAIAIGCTIYCIIKLLVKAFKYIDLPFRVKDEIEEELNKLNKED